MSETAYFGAIDGFGKDRVVYLLLRARIINAQPVPEKDGWEE